MENDLILKLDNVGPISNANINIGKINIIGGKNSTGKSTSSKLLYCFLRANSPSGDELIMNNMFSLMGSIVRKMQSFVNFRDEYGELIFNRNEIKTLQEMAIAIRRSHSEYNKTQLGMDELIDFYDILNNMFALISYKFDSENRRVILLKEDIELMNNTMDNIMVDSKEAYISILKELLDSEFNIQGPDDFGHTAVLESRDLDVKDFIDFKNFTFGHEKLFPVEEIYYLDSFSIFDNEINGLFYTEHVKSLKKDLKSNSKFKAGIHDSKLEINRSMEKEITNLLKGRIRYTRTGFEFVSEEGYVSQMKNTASGIKQIGVIQSLLSNFKLQPGTFIIIDEPEVNLHPDWQVKFAGILLLLAKTLDISFYISTHSPMFIEAVSLYSEYYDLLDETNIYLTEKEDGSSKFYFRKIDSKDMGEVYENLSKPYDELDRLKSQILFK